MEDNVKYLTGRLAPNEAEPEPEPPTLDDGIPELIQAIILGAAGIIAAVVLPQWAGITTQAGRIIAYCLGGPVFVVGAFMAAIHVREVLR